MQYIYAIIDANNICIGISYLCGKVVQDNMIQIDEATAETVLGSKYENGEWVAQPVEEPVFVQQEIIAESAALISRNIVVTLPEFSTVAAGTIVKFKAPCDCTKIPVGGGIKIGDTVYTLYDATGNPYWGKGGAFAKGAYVAIMIGDTKNAYLMNSAHVHTHDIATESDAGFMSAAMVKKLAGIATGANKTTVDSALSEGSTNPVQNKVVTAAIDSLVDATKEIPKIQYGTATIPFSTAPKGTSVYVAFPVAFSSAPAVAVQQVFDSMNIVVLCDDVTVNGFTAKLQPMSTEGKRKFAWIAIGT